MTKLPRRNMRIFDYAKVSEWDNRLSCLAAIAEPERWCYVHVPDRSPMPVLDAYIRYTFLRVHRQGKVAESDSYACFNTGLLTPNQEELYGVFRLSEKYDATKPPSKENRKWFLTTWARASDRELTGFMELPELATYWTDPAELIFNPRLKVQLNLDHIVHDNLNRFPTELGGNLDKRGVPTDIDASPDIETEASEVEEPEGVTSIRQVTDVPLATRNALEGAMKHSIRLAKRSYRLAVPQFHRGRIQLLLPLYLRESGRPDLALTLERHGEWYRAATVLYTDWAYRHARLLSRPNSEWLGGFLEPVDDAVG